MEVVTHVTANARKENILLILSKIKYLPVDIYILPPTNSLNWCGLSFTLSDVITAVKIKLDVISNRENKKSKTTKLRFCLYHLINKIVKIINIIDATP